MDLDRYGKRSYQELLMDWKLGQEKEYKEDNQVEW